MFGGWGGISVIIVTEGNVSVNLTMIFGSAVLQSGDASEHYVRLVLNE
jgi:hypothetical protein